MQDRADDDLVLGPFYRGFARENIVLASSLLKFPDNEDRLDD